MSKTTQSRLTKMIYIYIYIYIYKKVKLRLGKPTIETIESRGNNMVKMFYYFYPNPLTSEVDAFSFDWSQDIIYVFRHFNLILRVLQKIENEKIEEILVVPVFVNQSWFTRLVTFLIKEPLWLSSADISLTFPYRESRFHFCQKQD